MVRYSVWRTNAYKASVGAPSFCGCSGSMRSSEAHGEQWKNNEEKLSSNVGPRALHTIMTTPELHACTYITYIPSYILYVLLVALCLLVTVLDLGPLSLNFVFGQASVRTEKGLNNVQSVHRMKIRFPQDCQDAAPNTSSRRRSTGLRV